VYSEPRYIGLLPAAGHAARMNGLIKELLPFGKKLTIDFSIEQLAAVPVDYAYVITSPRKANYVFEQLGEERGGIPFAYVCQSQPTGLGAAVSLIEPFVDQGDKLCFLMPDTLMTPPDAMRRMSEVTDCDLVLGVHKVDDPWNYGVVAIKNGKCEEIVDKPKHPHSKYVWTSAIFDRKLFEIIRKLRDNKGEIQLTDAFAIASRKLRVKPIVFDEGVYYDFGTLEKYNEALSQPALAEITGRFKATRRAAKG